MDARTVPIIPAARHGAKDAAFEYLTTRKDELVGYETDRFGAALPRFSPRQADLLMVVGTVTHKQAPVLLKVYEQMCEPKWVMAFGVYATSGGFYQNYATLLGIDRVIPVDVYIPGSPPRPEMVIDGIMQLQAKIARSSHPILTRTF